MQWYCFQGIGGYRWVGPPLTFRPLLRVEIRAKPLKSFFVDIGVGVPCMYIRDVNEARGSEADSWTLEAEAWTLEASDRIVIW